MFKNLNLNIVIALALEPINLILAKLIVGGPRYPTHAPPQDWCKQPPMDSYTNLLYKSGCLHFFHHSFKMIFVILYSQFYNTIFTENIHNFYFLSKMGKNYASLNSFTQIPNHPTFFTTYEDPKTFKTPK